MTSIFTETAKAFVRLVDRYDWKEIGSVPKEDVDVLYSVVKAAGFKLSEIERGRVHGDYLDQDGTRTGKTYGVNTLCPFKVTDKDGKEHHHATGWLDTAVQTVRDILRNGTHQEAIDRMAMEIQRSRPLEPIRLTLAGDMLCENRPSVRSGYFVDHTRDEDEVLMTAGMHAYCRGWIDRNRATETHDALSCRNCNLRVTFSREITTYGELRSYFEQEHGSDTA